MNLIFKRILWIFIVLNFQCCTTNSGLVKLSELEIMSIIANTNYDVSQAIYKGFSNEILSEKQQKIYTKTYLGKDFYIDDKHIIKEIRFRDAVTYHDKLIDLSITYSLMKPAYTAAQESIDCKQLKISLEDIFDTDQESRITGIDMKKIDAINKNKAIGILEKCGMPKKKKVGIKAMLGVYVAIQHAPKEILGHYYPKFYIAAQEGDLPLATLATMQDRLLIQNNYDQVYGTQRASIGNYTIQDSIHVNERRKEVGLSPM